MLVTLRGSRVKTNKYFKQRDGVKKEKCQQEDVN